MQKYVNVRSTAETVQELEIDDYHVYVNSGIKEIHEEATDAEMEGGGFNGWEIAEQTIYDKDEYILLISEKNTALEQQATDMQLVLTEVYEMML